MNSQKELTNSMKQTELQNIVTKYNNILTTRTGDTLQSKSVTNRTKKSIQTAFVNQLLRLLQELTEIFPDDKDLRLGLSTLEMIQMVNPNMILVGFREFVCPYADYIQEKNEQFFLEIQTFQSLLQYDQTFLSTIVDMQQYWKIMTEKTKNQMWLYFQILLKLVHKYDETA